MSDQVDPPIATKAHEESPGVISAKRTSGLWMVALGAALLMSLGIYSLFLVAADPATAMQSGMALIITGAALLGVTIFEGVFKK
jgi:hypothetical protein